MQQRVPYLCRDFVLGIQNHLLKPIAEPIAISANAAALLQWYL
jgi:hypothetical protein